MDLGVFLALVSVDSFSIDAQISQAEKLFRQGKSDEAKKVITTYITAHENAF